MDWKLIFLNKVAVAGVFIFSLFSVMQGGITDFNLAIVLTVLSGVLIANYKNIFETKTTVVSKGVEE